MDSDEYLDVVSPLLRSFRAEILAGYGQTLHNVKDDKSVVTELDQKIERSIATTLTAQFPHIGIMGEEYGQAGNSNRYWLIDPIDGTELFVRGLPGVTSIMGLVENGQTTRAYVYDPVADILYSAVKERGAYANDKPIQVSTRPTGDAFIAVSSMADESSNLSQDLKSHGVGYVTRVYGSGIRSVYMATGKIDGVIVKSPNRGGPWDHAPTRLLMQEAGAKSIIVGEDMVGARMFALLNPAVYDDLHDVIEQHLNA